MANFSITICPKCDAKFIGNQWIPFSGKPTDACSLYKRVCTIKGELFPECANPIKEECAGNPEKGQGWDPNLPELEGLDPDNDPLRK